MKFPMSTPSRWKLPALRPLRERNQATVGAVTLVLLVVAAVVAFFAQDLPVIGSGTGYTATFRESAGLKPDDEVRLAGVKVGEVTDVRLDGNRVEVDFRARDVFVGDRTRAAIEIKTLLGEKYLSLEPAGRHQQDPDRDIPEQRTRSPFDVNDALNQLSRTSDQINTDQLARSFQTVSDTLQNTPPQMRGALDGLSQLSRTISSRDEQLSRLVSNTKQVSQIAADRNGQVQRLIADGNLLLGELQQREQAVDQLLTGTRALSDQLRGVVADNQQQLRPALQKLEQVTGLLQRNQDNLSRGLREMGPFIRNFNNTLGNGRWFDGYLCGLVPPTSLGVPIGLNSAGCPPPNNGPGGGR